MLLRNKQKIVIIGKIINPDIADKSNRIKPIGMITPLDLREEEFTDEGLRDAIGELSTYYK